MRHLLLAMALLMALAHTAWAGPEMLVAVLRTCKAQTGTTSSLNGITDITNDASGDPDTGVATPSTLALCSGTASIVASCYGGDSGSFAQVFLKINGTVVQSISCGTAATQSNVTLSWPVSGKYTAQVFGTKSGTGTYTANSFIFPIAQ